ncbi:hypothetical protein Asphe3_37250 [Pseudarthrobacter phenanthrenivorans Sphe3]|uniref:Methane oxygenase PmoA n=1 Tax=Pseudarthrobacter phenanthrenivorans (strain DSM 18606 / JCM 16027 / LMG 23796 / Sphe3) TaxID=930171 RepID=F0M7P3_PSEPM|nr:PmoA family protein [Pseudarthrobacter phenanthrenivorans]ADX74822.1 hypothetical protein Asphe3_37250 [Pseudarthrobacter phenanthrenivorans Sphe3]
MSTTAATTAADAPATQLTWTDNGAAVVISLDGTDILTYTYAADDPQVESPRPYFHPVRTRSGDLVSAYRPHDHVWHKGIAWSLPHLGPDNFWGGPSYRRGQDYQWLPNNGAMRHLETVQAANDDGAFSFAHRLQWVTQRGSVVVQEERSFQVVPGQDASYTLVFETAMSNVSGKDIHIGSPTTEGRENAGYGGLFWRGPRSFTGGKIIGPGGATGEGLRGQRAPWLSFVGQHDETCRFSTVVMVDDPGSAHPEPEWFARSEPFACMGPAPFFRQEVLFQAGTALRFRYGVVIADGTSDADRAEALATAARSVLAGAPAPVQGG